MPTVGGVFPWVLLKLYMRRNTTGSQGRANCAISLALLAFGGMTLYQGTETMTSVLHQSYLKEERLCDMLAISVAEPQEAP